MSIVASTEEAARLINSGAQFWRACSVAARSTSEVVVGTTCETLEAPVLEPCCVGDVSGEKISGLSVDESAGIDRAVISEA